LHPQARRYFGFELADAAGVVRFYQFTVMVYGFKSAVRVVTRLILPIKSFLHKLGVRFLIYVDDGHSMAADPVEAYWKHQLVLTVFQLAGWTVQWAKTTKLPAQRLLYQGFVIDTVQLKFYTPPEKLLVLAELLEHVLSVSASGQQVAARYMALVLGKIVSMIRSHGNILQVLTRSTQHVVGAAVLQCGWDSILFLTPDSVRELALLKDVIFSFNGQFLSDAAGSGSADLQKINFYCDLIRNSAENVSNLFVSDASAEASFVYRADGTFDFVHEYKFETGQAEASSGMRELLAVKMALQSEPQYFRQFAGQKIFWQTDSQNCHGFLLRGSRKPDIQKIVFDIKLLERQVGIVLVPVWTPRTHDRIVIADLGSKWSLSTDEWSVDRCQLRILFDILNFQPTVDCFASGLNAVCAKYFSRQFEIGAAGVNFFVQPLSQSEYLFCCPPVAMIIPCFWRLRETPGLQCLLLVPEWHSASFWPVLFPRGVGQFVFDAVYRFQPSFFYANFAHSAVFCNKPKFAMLALVMKT
jgi:hypothetical protein